MAAREVEEKKRPWNVSIKLTLNAQRVKLVDVEFSSASATRVNRVSQTRHILHVDRSRIHTIQSDEPYHARNY